VKIVGYQPDFVNHKYNHFVFFHRTKSCGQVFGIRASYFSDLREGKCPKELGMGMGSTNEGPTVKAGEKKKTTKKKRQRKPATTS
jgi:hypothetical protein